MTTAPLLVVGIGNPSRGDDAIGPLFVERATQALKVPIARGAMELLTDFQLQVEHALDLEGRTRVIFVDASVTAAAPFDLSRIAARRDASVLTHAMTPEGVLEVHRSLVGEPPDAWLLAIRGYTFELGDPLSEAAKAHLDAALEHFFAFTRACGEVAGAPPEPGALESRGVRLEVRGVVQGVGFRPWVGRTARRLGLTGEVRNTVRGVTIDAFGSAAALDALARCVAHDAPTAARVREVLSTPIAPRPSVAFTIAPSETSGEPIVALPPDLPTCDACLADVRRPEGRHHGYVFTSCAECGPRLSIAVALPYDRAATTMAPFEPCDSCSVEYASPEDRRFHAQTIACPVCGPRAWLADRRGIEMASSDVVEAAAKRLDEGQILAVQGLGAFHLMCDATNPGAVARMRREKRREAQPFAVMVADVTAAEAIADLDGAAREALTSRPRPIVLAPTRASAVAAEVNGPSRRTGILLPYTPLTHRLAVRVGRPIVVTSGNTSGGPAIIERGEAMARLGSIADAFLLSDRPIARRVEDSVVAASATGTRIVRRGRGFAPLPIRLPCSSPEPVLAVGGHTKNTACLVVDDLAYLTPHLGDLGWVEGEAAWRRDIESFERLLRVRADVLAHDLHPDYASTRLAFARPARRRVGVQHHVAHVLSTLAELHIGEPVVGVVFDGTGWGGDGTLWGSELLLVDGGQWTRALTFRPMSLPGGEAAIRDVWRAALAVLVDAYGRDEALVLAARLRVFEGMRSSSLATVSRAIERGVGTVRAHGMGRWFDAIGALALGIRRADYDGHVAMALEDAAAFGPVNPYSIAVPDLRGASADPTPEMDLRPATRGVVQDLLSGVATERVAARFHATIARATISAVETVLAATGIRRVVLTGGTFQNRLLETALLDALGTRRVATAREVPINDGGLSLGQAWAAVLALRAERK